MLIRRGARWLGVLVAVLAVASACAPSTAPSGQSAFVQQDVQPASRGGANFDADGPQGAQGGNAAMSSDKTLVIGLGIEVKGFSAMNNNQQKYVEDLVQGNLFLQNDQGRWFPALAAETPSLDNGTWRLLENGTSETTYRLKRGVKWHDGVEFTVHDLAFFWRVGRDPELPYEERDRAERILNMEALDDYTVRVTWDNWETEADTVDLRMMWPMPRHILEGPYTRGDKQEFAAHPYWSTGFVGLGPYKLSRFEHGSHLELTAYDDYTLGRPNIRNIVVRFYQDTNVLISAVLAGDVHLTLHGATREGALSMNDGIVLGTQWSATSEGRVLFNPYRINVLAVQWNRDFVQPAALSDVRTRQALLHAIDRPTLIAERFSGFTQVADGWLHPTDGDAPMFADAVAKYDFDPTRAQRLFADVGFQRGSDGVLTDSAGRKLTLEYRAQGRDAEVTAAAVADYWKRIGVDTQLLFIPTARARDNEWMAKFPGIRSHAHVTAPVGGGTNSYNCERVPSERNRWVPQAQNPGGFCTQEMQAHYEAWRDAFPFDARLAPYKEMMRVALRDLPYLPLHYESEVVAVSSLVGGINRVPPKNRGRIAMHSYTWTIR